MFLSLKYWLCYPQWTKLHSIAQTAPKCLDLQCAALSVDFLSPVCLLYLQDDTVFVFLVYFQCCQPNLVGIKFLQIVFNDWCICRIQCCCLVCVQCSVYFDAVLLCFWCAVFSI